MSNAHLTRLRKIKAGSASNKAVMNCIADHADESGKWQMSIKQIANETELSPDTVSRCLVDLVRRGLITRTPTMRGGSRWHDIYILTLPAPCGDHTSPHHTGTVTAPCGEGDSTMRGPSPHHGGDSIAPLASEKPHGAPSVPSDDVTSEAPDLILEEQPSVKVSKKPAKKPKPTEHEYSEDFLRFWSAYPQRAGSRKKRNSWVAWQKAINRADPETIIAAAARFAANQERLRNVKTKYIPIASTWLNEDQWQDFDGTESAPETISDIVDRIIKKNEAKENEAKENEAQRASNEAAPQHAEPQRWQPPPSEVVKEPEPEPLIRIPPDWTLTDADRAFAIEQGMSEADIDKESKLFVGYYTRNNSKHADWSENWKERVKNFVYCENLMKKHNKQRSFYRIVEEDQQI